MTIAENYLFYRDHDNNCTELSTLSSALIETIMFANRGTVISTDIWSVNNCANSVYL